MAWGNNGTALAIIHEKDVVSPIVQQTYSRERANGIYWIGSWLGPTAGVHTLGKRRNPLFLPGIEQFSLARGQVSVLTVVITCCATAQRLVAGLSSRRSQFSPRPVYVRFVVNRVALGYISFCPDTLLVPCQYHCTNGPFSFIPSSITDARLVSSYLLTVSLNNSHSRGTLKQCFSIGGTRNVVYWRATLFRN